MDFSIALKSPPQIQFAANTQKCFWSVSKGSSSFSFVLPYYSQNRSRINKGKSAITAAAAKKENNKRKKDDTHSFVSRPDEATGPFPEAVLLKQKKVEEGGKLMPEFADAEERKLYDSLNLQLESDLNLDQMRHYEVVYLIHEDHKEEVENVNIKIQDFLKEKKGKIWRFSDWGMRRLAYKIQKAKSAHYILMNFELEAKWINDFKSMLDKDERVIRHLVIKRDKAETQVCPPPPEFFTTNDDVDEDWDDVDDDEDIIYVDDDDIDDEEESSNFGVDKKETQRVG